MRVEQHDKAYGKRTIKRVIVVIAALIGIGVFMIPTVFGGPRITTVGYILIGVWGFVLAIGVIWAARVRSRYYCPRCGAHLPPLESDASTNYQHRFQCTACDVIWTTDVYTGDAPIAQPGAAPNAVPAASVGDSGVITGPPSLSVKEEVLRRPIEQFHEPLAGDISIRG